MIASLPRCVLFDLDGTLLDSLPGIEYSVREAFASCQLPPPRVSLRSLIGPPIRTILSRVGNVTDAGMLAALEQAFRSSYDTAGWRMAACYPGAKQVLRLMREREHRLFVVSNKPRQIALQILEAEEIVNLFEVVMTRDSRLPHYSGKVEMIGNLVSERLLSPENCLLTGDTMEDAEAAATAGIRFAFMTHGYGEIAENASVSVDFRFDHFLQFLPLMAKELVHD
jgi:phosphoglycolate phosphatase